MPESRTLHTDHPVRYEVEQHEVSLSGFPAEFVPGRPTWSIEPIEFDSPEQARLLVGERLVVVVQGDGAFHGIGEYAEGDRLTVRITGPAGDAPEEAP